ncbi:MAG: 1-deoxy-D-xylulose-5-phosphate reductoisomerase [Lachnospiraceae bacterium]|nr:1-deoxy-D-xylulose-5-phosphate reductoisomerase [Lachnospiraceae bacterium]
MRKLSVIGSTGSIGRQALEVVRNNPGKLSVLTLAACTNIDILEEQIREFAPKTVCVFNEDKAKELSYRVRDLSVRIVSGMEGLIECAAYDETDMTLMSVVGMIGVRPTIEAIKAGKDIALANKETLVTAGHIIMPLVREKGVKLLPVDSEHSAIFQSLRGEETSKIEKVLLTASGGPFRGMKRKDLEKVTLADALKHPNWSMGKKITVDSSTLVNKGLEVCEVKWLFDVDPDNIQVVVQPQSILHSAVQFSDGAIIGQMGIPDMKLPIQFALLYPDRSYLNDKRVDLFELGSITFEKPDTETFKALPLAYRALKTGGNMPTVFNAANEEAVARFLDGKIGFLQITEEIERAMDSVKFIKDPSLEEILWTEMYTRELQK